jgi:hypothetical protein
MILYEGPSLLNGEPIVAIATGLASPSTNRKTGPMIQTWILVQDEAPHLAVKSGNDSAVCGDCPARGKWCYVTTFQGPRSIWETWKRGGYPPSDLDELKGKAVRFGAYGDPAAVPFEVWDEIGIHASMTTGVLSESLSNQVISHLVKKWYVPPVRKRETRYSALTVVHATECRPTGSHTS